MVAIVERKGATKKGRRKMIGREEWEALEIDQGRRGPLSKKY